MDWVIFFTKVINSYKFRQIVESFGGDLALIIFISPIWVFKLLDSNHNPWCVTYVICTWDSIHMPWRSASIKFRSNYDWKQDHSISLFILWLCLLINCCLHKIIAEFVGKVGSLHQHSWSFVGSIHMETCGLVLFMVSNFPLGYPCHHLRSTNQSHSHTWHFFFLGGKRQVNQTSCDPHIGWYCWYGVDK